MVDRMRKLYIVPILLSMLMVGCSSGANQASAPPNDANANASPPVAQGAPSAASDSQPSVATPLAPAPAAPKPDANAAAKPAAPANPITPGATARAGAPKLILPASNVDFGSVYQGKSLTRNLVVRNAGKADLSIESVVPS
jgi:predicted lipid-binding transport protein (Tim44 family)